MCRTGARHCRERWTEDRRARENALRRISRNTAKARFAWDNGLDAKAASYDRLVIKAQQELRDIDQRIAAHQAETEAPRIEKATQGVLQGLSAARPVPTRASAMSHFSQRRTA